MAYYRLESMVMALIVSLLPYMGRKEEAVQKEIQVGIDAGWEKHVVEILHLDGRYERMTLEMDFDSFNRLLARLEQLKGAYGCEIVIGIEGSNGIASPLDEYLISKGYRVYNTSGTQLNKFRSLYGAEFKNDEYDGKLICAYLKNRKGLVLEKKEALVEVLPKREAEEQLKVLSRTISNIIKDQRRMTNQLISCLKSYFPEMVQMIKYLDRKWLLIILKEYPRPSQLREQTVEGLRKIKDPESGMRIREHHAAKLIELAKKVSYISLAEEEKGYYVSYLAEELIRKIDKIKELEKKVAEIGEKSETYRLIDQLAGAGSKTTSRLAGEIGNIDRFRQRGEAGLAAYFGVCKLDNDSGKTKKDKKNIKANRRAKNAALELAYQSTRFNRKSRIYYDKKRREGKTHLHALRCLARHMTRNLYKDIVFAQGGTYLNLKGEAA